MTLSCVVKMRLRGFLEKRSAYSIVKPPPPVSPALILFVYVFLCVCVCVCVKVYACAWKCASHIRKLFRHYLSLTCCSSVKRCNPSLGIRSIFGLYTPDVIVLY